MCATAVQPSYPVFVPRDGQLWLDEGTHGSKLIALNAASLGLKGGKIVDCYQVPGRQPPSIRLCITIANDLTHEIFMALIPDPQQVFESRKLSARLFKRMLSSATPISKISAIKDGIFVSAKDGALYYGDVSGRSPNVHTLLAAPTTLAASASGPMADIITAKDGIAEFLSNLLDALPKMAAAVEKRVVQEVLDAFAAAIKAQQQELAKVFNQPLSALIQQTPQPSAKSMLAAVIPSPGESAEHAVRRLFMNKLELGRILSPFSEQATLSADIPAEVVSAEAVAATDPIDALGNLFQPLSKMLNANNTKSLLSMGAADLLEAISGAKPISDVLNDVFNIFKIDETMNTLHSILSGGQCSTLIGQIPLKDYLSKPVDNEFFNALYDHYFPGKKFTALDFAAFMAALFGYIAFVVQGKTSTFNSVFSDPQNLKELTSAPDKLVQAISGSSTASTPMPVSNATSMPTDAASGGAKLGRVTLAIAPSPAAAAEDSPPAGLVAAGALVSTLVTLAIGVSGVFNFGTGLLASPITGGVAAGVGQCLGGMLQNLDTRDAKWDLLGGFVGGFTGALLSTLIGNKLFGIWAQKGDTPSARIQKLKLIMIGFSLTLGGGGGAVISSLVKNYAKSQKLVFDDALALTTGAVGGIGGGAMGCGLHFMGALSGSMCLPVELPLAEATTIRLSAITPATPTLDNAVGLPQPYALFPPGLLANPNTAMGMYRTEFRDPVKVPSSGRAFALVKWSEYSTMDGPPGPTRYKGQREKLFWLEAGATPATPPPPARIADLVIGVHGIGRYVFPCITHADPNGGAAVDFTRPMYKDDFANFMAAQTWVTDFLNGIRNSRSPIIKLAVCFSALPFGCCSLSQELATTLNATVYGGRPPVYPWLDATSSPRVPGWGGWVKYTP